MLNGRNKEEIVLAASQSWKKKKDNSEMWLEINSRDWFKPWKLNQIFSYFKVEQERADSL